MHCSEYEDLVAAHVDGQLTQEERALAQAHVASCEKCAHLLVTQRAMQQALRAGRVIQPTPEPVRRAIMAQIAAAPEQKGTWRAWLSPPAARFVLAGAAALLIIAVALPLLRSTKPAPAALLFDRIVADYRAAEADRVEFRARTDDPLELRTYYYQTGAFTFTNTVVDLEPIGFVLQGGTVTTLAGQRSTLSVHRGTRGVVVCHRISAAGVELPPGGEVMGGDRFYTVDGITICVHRDGEVLCFMASAMPRADFVRLLVGHA